MRHRTTATTRWIALVLIVCAAMVASWFAARQRVGPYIRSTHTDFLFTQFEHSYADYLRAGNTPVASERSFRELIPIWAIDWNSCEFRDGMVFDAWGTEIQIR